MSEDKVRTKYSCWSVGTIYDLRELRGVSIAGPRIGQGVTLYELAKEFDRLSLEFLNNTQGVTVELEPTLEQDIRKGQKDDEKINEIRQLIIEGKGPDFHEDTE